MNKQQMLDRIYAVIADKTLSFGCNVHHTLRNERDHFQYITDYPDVQYLVDSHKIVTFNWKCFSCECNEWSEYKIIWHPVMIGDVLDWIYENDIDQVELHQLMERKKYTNFTYTPASVMVIALWKEKRKPIDDQSDECIKFVYDLLPKE